MKKLALSLTVISLLFPLIAGAQTDPATTADASQPAASTPSGAAYQYQREGIFDCNQNGAYAMSVGALSATAGAYVPVADAAVELNTGTLVYKECVLREVVDRERESALSALGKQGIVAIQTGRNGNPLYVQNRGELVSVVDDPTVLKYLQGNTLQNLSPALQGPITRAVAQSYEVNRNNPASALTCPYQNTSSVWDTVLSAGSVCNPIIALPVAQELLGAQLALNEQFQQNVWNQGDGFYARTDANGNIVTPSSVVDQSFEQLLQSPVQQLQNANDIGQMIGALYAGITTQVIGDQNGLAGLSQSVGGQPSYLDQVAAEASAGLQGAATNAALQILSAEQQIESAYYQAVSAIAASLTQSSQQLQSAEAQCWTAIIPKVCATPLAANNTCTAQVPACTDDSCPTGATLHVATSTAFSQAVISTQITPFVAPAAADIQASQQALQLINNLIQGVTNTTSLDAQRVALQQLDTLVAQHQLHSQTDLTNVTQQQSAVANTMSTLLQKVAQTWSGTGTDANGNPFNTPWDGTINPGNGWCNIGNSATLAAWQQKWK